MVRDTTPTSYVFDIDLRSRHLTPQIFLSSEVFASAVFLAQLLAIICANLRFFHFSDRIHGILFLLAVSGNWLCQPPCSRLIVNEDQHSKCVRCVGLAHARDAIFGISNCKYCKNFTLKTLSTIFLTENLPFFLAVLLRRPPSSVKPRPGVWRWSSRPWRVSSFHFLSLHRLGVTAQVLRSSFLSRLSCTQPGDTGRCFLRVGGYFIYRGLRLWGLWGHVTRLSPA